MRRGKILRWKHIFSNWCLSGLSRSPLAQHTHFLCTPAMKFSKNALVSAQNREQMHTRESAALSFDESERDLREIMLTRAAHKIFCLMYFYGRRNAKLIRVDIFINQMAKEVVHLRIVCDAAASAKGLLDYSMWCLSHSISLAGWLAGCVHGCAHMLVCIRNSSGLNLVGIYLFRSPYPHW